MFIMASTEVDTFLRLYTANTKRRYTTVINDFKAFIGPNTSLADITVSDAYQYLDHLKQRDGINSRGGGTASLAGATIRNAVETLRSLYRYLTSIGLITINPFDAVANHTPSNKFNQKRPTEIVPFDKVMELCNVPSRFSPEGIRDRAILAALFGGGLRKSEVLNLTLGDVRTQTTKEGEIVFYLRLSATKSGYEQHQALPDWAAERMMRLIEVRRVEQAKELDPLFCTYVADNTTNASISIRTLDRLFRSWCDNCGLPETITCHSARATAISQLLAQGVSHREVQLFARHSSVVTTEGYDKRYFGIEKSVALVLKY
jgi:site-specific recombinase XerD